MDQSVEMAETHGGNGREPNGRKLLMAKLSQGKVQVNLTLDGRCECGLG